MKIYWNPWIVFGLIGQAMFASRFIVQWVCSEKRKESYVPVLFWYLSMAGGLILLIYATYRRDPVFMIGQATGIFVYSRNLMLIHEKGQRRR